MDLNRAMVEMYKKRSQSNSKRRPPAAHTKRPKVDAAPNGTARDHAPDQPEELAAELSFRVPDTSFANLHGCEPIKQKLILHINRFSRAVSGQARRSKRPLLVCGSAGIGKTSMVEAAANYAQLKLVPLNLKHLVTQSRIEFKITTSQLEAHIRQSQPAIVLVDDLDEINEKEELRFIVRELIRRLLADQTLHLLVFCTSLNSTTSLEMDFLTTFQLKRPDLEARRDILRACCAQNPCLKGLLNSARSLEALALDTPSFTPHDLDRMLDLAEAEATDGEPTLSHCRQSIDEVKQSFKRGTHLIGQKPSVTWADIGGLPEVRHEFKDIMEQVASGDINCKFAGIALYGPPGCGKTMVAQAMANEAGLNFIAIKPCELISKFLGETERNIRQVFSEAREFEPCMIYFDEFDGLCGTRGNKDNITGAIQTLLSEMDGFAERGKSIVLVSTNRLEDIDPAMKRPGRLSEHIFVGPPNETGRKEILQVITRRPTMALASDVDLDEWARRTHNFTGAELDHLVMHAYRKALPTGNSNSKLLTLAHFECAFEKIQTMKKKETRTPKVILE